MSHILDAEYGIGTSRSFTPRLTEHGISQCKDMLWLKKVEVAIFTFGRTRFVGGRTLLRMTSMAVSPDPIPN